MSSSAGLFAPVAASLSACSFPSVPSCPLTHLNRVGAPRALRWYAVAWIHCVLGVFVQLVSSRSGSDRVSILIAYCESVTSVSFVVGGTDCSATSIAASSPVWFDCSNPGTLMLLLMGWLSATQTPALLLASCLPLLVQDPSVNTVSSG